MKKNLLIAMTFAAVLVQPTFAQDKTKTTAAAKQSCGIGAVVGIPQLKEDANRKPTDPHARISDKRPLFITVIRANSPAAKADLFPGDQIQKIDGASVNGLTVDEAVAKIKGAEDSIVKITFIRNIKGKPTAKTVDVRRAKPPSPTK